MEQDSPVKRIILILILILILFPDDGMVRGTGPHQLTKLTWRVTSTLMGDEVTMVTENHPLTHYGQYSSLTYVNWL